MKHAENIETLPIADLVPYARNARTHSEAQIDQIARSITEFGFTNPVLIDAEGGIVAGHGRVMAAKRLGWRSVPCLRVSWLTEAQKRAYVIADNKLAMLSEWDDRALAKEVASLQQADADISMIGFDDEEVAALLAPGRMEKSFARSDSGTAIEDNYLQEESQNLFKFPVTVVLDEKEFDKWNALKEKRGFSDKRLLISLMEGEKC